MTLARLMLRAGEMAQMGLDCSTCEGAIKAARGCMEQPTQLRGRPAWTPESYADFLAAEGERVGLPRPATDSPAAATWIYPMAASLGVVGVTGDYWYACPMSYAVFADPGVIHAADLAVDAAIDLVRRKLPPAWMPEPTLRQYALIRVATDGLVELQNIQDERRARERERKAQASTGRRCR